MQASRNLLLKVRDIKLQISSTTSDIPVSLLCSMGSRMGDDLTFGDGVEGGVVLFFAYRTSQSVTMIARLAKSCGGASMAAVRIGLMTIGLAILQNEVD